MATRETDVSVAAQQIIDLPRPKQTGGLPLFDAIKARHSTREFDGRALPLTTISSLMWAAYGVNRPTGEHTAPSWRHSSEIDVFAVTATGIWRYAPKAHRLLPCLAGDWRAQTGHQDYVGQAPLNLVYVGDLDRMAEGPVEERRLAAYTDAGFIGQNVYLFCASEGLATVFRGLIDRENFARLLGLGKDQVVTYAQTVGFPKSAA
jgi:nitroreductase